MRGPILLPVAPEGFLVLPHLLEGRRIGAVDLDVAHQGANAQNFTAAVQGPFNTDDTAGQPFRVPYPAQVGEVRDDVVAERLLDGRVHRKRKVRRDEDNHVSDRIRQVRSGKV